MPPSNLGGVGESCLRRADCEAGLMCVANVCHHEYEGSDCQTNEGCPPQLACREGVCQGRFSSAARPWGEPPASDWTAFDGTRFYGQVLPGGGFTVFNRTTPFGFGDTEVFGSAVFFLRLGLTIDLNAVTLEVAPLTAWHSVLETSQLIVTASYARYIRLSDHLFWRLGLGVGVSAVELPAAFQVLIEPVGLTYRVGPLMLDFIVPSFRLNVNPESDDYAFLDDWESFFFLIGIGFITNALGE